MSRPERDRPVRKRRPTTFTVPARLPGEAAYGVFISHVMECAGCDYGQAQCEKAVELWKAYKEARRNRI
ncbi:hypothetical protein [Streptomyces adelaidensis]|uniref:hypothetical protein n=1 Tax=Streptomyces adelaidensis TaxID=2796465 RepID=UPI001908DC71|nr:hypothetical protein [Streptomyces adelaidensis]